MVKVCLVLLGELDIELRARWRGEDFPSLSSSHLFLHDDMHLGFVLHLAAGRPEGIEVELLFLDHSGFAVSRGGRRVLLVRDGIASSFMRHHGWRALHSEQL